jgi:type I restriction enzyme S subunit
MTNHVTTEARHINWATHRLGELVEIIKGKKPDKLTSTFNSGSLPYLTAEFLRTGSVKKYVENCNSSIICEPEEVILIWDGSNAGDVFRGAHGILASTMVKILPSRHLDSSFLYFLLRSQFATLNGKTTGSTIPHVSKTVFHNLQVSLPPISEQRRIASVLANIERAMKTQNQVIGAALETKRSLTHHLFNYGPAPITQTATIALKQTEVGPIPQHWELATLSSLAQLVQYGTSERAASDTSGQPTLGIPNVVSGKITRSVLRYLSAPPLCNTKYELQTGDLLFVRTNASRQNVGRCAVYMGDPPKAIFASYLIRVRLQSKTLLPGIVQSFTETAAGRNQLSGRASGAADGKFNINSQTIRSLVLPVPSLSEQQQILNVLNAADEKIRAESQRSKVLKLLFKSALHHLVSDKICVPELLEV